MAIKLKGSSSGLLCHVSNRLSLMQRLKWIWLVCAIRDPGGLGCNPHRTAVWNSVVVGQLNTMLRHSKYCLPPRLCGPVSRFLSPQSQQRLQDWQVQAKEAIDVRQAAIRERIAKAKYLNVQQLRAPIARGGTVDLRMVQAALGKRQPRQRIWGVSGPVKLGVSNAVTSDSQCAFLEFLSTTNEVEGVHRLVGGSCSIQLWFRGPGLLETCCLSGVHFPPCMEICLSAHTCPLRCHILL